MFNMPPSQTGVDPNPPSTSFNAQIAGGFGHSGLWDSSQNHLETIFAILNFYYLLTRDMAKDSQGKLVPKYMVDDNTAIEIAAAILTDVGKKWNDLYPDYTKDPVAQDLKNIMDNDDFTEIIRRLPGFLSMTAEILNPLLEPAQLEKSKEQSKAQAEYVLDRLLQHLECNRNYYIREFLHYVSENTHHQSIIDFVTQISEDPKLTAKLKAKNISLAEYDFARSFIDSQIV